MLPYKKTGEFHNGISDLETQNQSHLGMHFVHILFPKCKSRILEEWGLCNFFPLPCQFERHKLLQWFLLLYLQQIRLCRLISILFPTGSLDPSPFCWSVPEQGRMMYVICHFILSHSDTFKAAFPLTEDLSFFMESGTAFSAQLSSISTGVWGRTGLVNKVVMHYRRLTSETFGFSVSGLMSWTTWSCKTAVSWYSVVLRVSCSLPSQGREKSENSHHHLEKKCMSCHASVKLMGINRMMLLHRWRGNKIGPSWPQIFSLLIYFLILWVTAALLHIYGHSM